MASKIKNGNGNKNGNSKHNGTGDKMHAEARKERRKIWKQVIFILIAVLAISLVFVVVKVWVAPLFGDSSLNGKLAARVGSETITLAELDKEYAKIPASYQTYISKETYLQNMIDERVLLMEVDRLKISATETEVDAKINEFIAQNGITKEKVTEILQSKGISYDEFIVMVRKQIVLDKLVTSEVRSKVTVSDEEAQKYYMDNTAAFKFPEMVTARHILISVGNISDPVELKAGEEKAAKVMKEIKSDNSNFCDLVVKYSEDPGSRDNCGEYTFSRGQMIQEFEDAAFGQKVGATSIVKTDFGYHIVWTVNKTAEGISQFQEVKDYIVAALTLQKQKVAYTEYLAGLKNNVKITNYLEIAAANEETAETIKTTIEPGTTDANTPVESTPVVNEPVETIPVETNPVETKPVETKPVETAPAAAEPLATSEPVTVEIPTAGAKTLSVDEIASCLSMKGVVLYGAAWDSSTKKQKAAFEGSADKLIYVECSVAGSYSDEAQICKDKKIAAYPTWSIAGTQYMGVFQPAQLAAFAGCN